MGSRMALRLLDAGHEVTGFDCSATAMDRLEPHGLRRAETPSDLGSQADLVITSLPDGAAVLEVLSDPDGLLGNAAFTTYVEASTIGPQSAKQAAALLAAKSIAMLDGPVSGGIEGAAAGTLTMMLAGSPETAATCADVLSCVARRVVYLGPEPGQGQAMKIINNLLEATALCVTAEGMGLGIKAGLNPRQMVEVLSSSSGRNSATEVVFPNSVLSGTFNEGFGIGLADKDLRLCLEYADQENCAMWIGAAVRQWMSHARATHGFAADFTTVVKEIERWDAVTIRADTEASTRDEV